MGVNSLNSGTLSPSALLYLGNTSALLAVTVEKMVREIRRLLRGKCNNCNACYGLVTLSQRSECDYCGCPPTQHVEIPGLEPGPCKRFKLEDPPSVEQPLKTEATSAEELSTSGDTDRQDDDDDADAYTDVEDDWIFEDLGLCRYSLRH